MGIGKKEIMLGVVVLLAVGGAVALIASMASNDWLKYKTNVFGVELISTVGLRKFCFPILGCFNQTYVCSVYETASCKLLKAGAGNAALGSIAVITAVAGAILVVLLAFVFKKEGKFWKLLGASVLLAAFVLAIVGLIEWGAQASSWRGESTANEEYKFSGGFAGDIIAVILLCASFVVAML